MTQLSLLIPHGLMPELVKDILSQGAECRFKAKGYSMSPFIKDGDIVTVSPILYSSLGIGDVVAFIHKETGRFLIHRVVGKNGESYLTKGDNTLQGDGFISEANILGYVTEVERNGKKVFLGLGPERFLIGLLTRKGPFLSFVLPIWRVLPSIIRKRVRLLF